MPPKKVNIPLDVRYRKLLEDFREVERELKEEQRLRAQAEQRNKELERSWPEQGLRLDRLKNENDKLRSKVKRLEKSRK